MRELSERTLRKIERLLEAADEAAECSAWDELAEIERHLAGFVPLLLRAVRRTARSATPAPVETERSEKA